MSLVNADTGELIAECTPDEARQLTDRIHTGLGVMTELYIEAYTRRAWAALGHPTWDAYTAAEFGRYQLRLPAEERTEAITSLREAGLSIRAIAATGVASKKTVERTIAASGVANDDTSTTGTDGKKYDAIHRAKSKPQPEPVDPGKCTEGFDCPATPGPDGLCAWHRGRAKANAANTPAEPEQEPAPVPAPNPEPHAPQRPPAGLSDAQDADVEDSAPSASAGDEPGRVALPVPAVTTPPGWDWDVVFAMSPKAAALLHLTEPVDVAVIDDALTWCHLFFAALKEQAA